MPHRPGRRLFPFKRRFPTFVLLAFLCFAPVVVAEDLDARLARLCEALEAERVEQHIPGMSLCVVKDDEIVLARGFGVRDRETKEPVDESTLFAVGSTTKAFTATLIGMLADEGKMSWDDPVRKHIPFFALHDETAHEKVTVRDLLCHRTGLTRMGALWAANQVSRERVLREVVKAEPLAGFRETFLYNNVMYLAAGESSARAAGTDWDALLKKRILDPLGMKRSNSSVKETLAAANHSKGYLWHEEKKDWLTLPMRDLSSIAPAGAINSCATDMGQWVRLLLAAGEHDGKRLVSEKSLEETWTSQLDIGPGVGYGLGWMLRDWNGKRVIEHGGNIDGFAAAVALLPEESLGFVLLMNVSMAGLQQQSLEIVWDALLGDAPEQEKPADVAAGKKLSPEELERYLGRYRIDMLGVDATVQMKDEKLAVDIPGQMVFTLKWPDDEGKWVFDFSADIQVSFDDESPDKAAQMTFYQQVNLPCARNGEGASPVDDAAPKPAAGEKWSEAQLKPLVGKYTLPTVGEVTILVDGERLAIDIPGQKVFPLHWPDKEDKWVIEEAPDQALRFLSGSDGKVSSMTFHRSIVMNCPRIRPTPDIGVTLDELIALQGTPPEGGATKAMRFEGTIRFVHQGASGKFVSYVASPTRFTMKLDIAPFGYVVTTCDGDHGWIDSNMEMSSDMGEAELELAKLSNPFAKYADWRKSFKEVHLLRKDTFEGEDVYVVECVPDKASVITKYVSAKTGNVVGEESAMMARGVGISIPITAVYADFREVAGFKMPYRATTMNEHMGEMILEITKVEENVEVPKDAFEKPGR